VTIFDGHDLVCEHRRLTGRKGQHSTLAEHVPRQHQGIDGLWSRRWFTDRARSFGPATVQVFEQILDRHAIEAQGYLDCLRAVLLRVPAEPERARRDRGGPALHYPWLRVGAGGR